MMQIDSDINESLILENLRALQITNKKPDEMELIGILFKTSNNEVVDLTCNLLKKLMRSGNMQQVDVALLLPGLSSPNVNIVTTVLEYLSRQSSQEQETLEILVSLLDHKDQGVVEQSITILEKAAVASENVENIFAWIQPILQPHLDSQNISSYELVARWCQQSADAFKACSNTGMIEFATEFSPFRDVLLSLTVIELFKDISKTHTGFSFLVQTGVLQKLSSVLFADDVLELVMAATIKFWGLVSFQQPEKLELLDSMGIFKQMTELHSLALKIEVVVAIGNVGSTSQGLLFLSDQSILLNYYLDEVFAFASGDLKLDCLKTLSCLLEHREHPEISAKILHSAFKNQVPVEALISLSKNSILEISISAFSCLTNLCNFDWGCQQIADSPSFQYFLERKPELSNIVKEWKFSVLKAIFNNPNTKPMFAPTVYRKIQEFIQDGPFKAIYNPQVSFETS